MSVLVGNPFFLGAGASAGGYEIERSLRFNSADSAYLSRTPASAGNRKTWTWAGWVKGVVTSENPHLFACTTGATDATYFRLWFVSDSIRVSNYNNTLRQTSAVYRDPSAWYHIVLAVDTTQATAANRIKLYVNGSEVTAFSSSTNPSQNDDLGINQAAAHSIGATSAGTATFSGLLADIFFIDGQALTPSSFGEFDTNNVWQPKAYSGTYSGNSFWLPFSDNSAATATTLGKDNFNLGNNWTPNNLSVGGAQPALYSSPNLYTSAADVIANGTPLSSGSTFSSVYVYLVTNDGGTVGSKVFTADGSGNIGTNWTWLHRIGGSWTSSGSYNNSEWDQFTWGSEAVATTYIMNNSAPLHMLVSSAGSPQQVTGTIATFNSTPNSGAGNDSLVDSPSSPAGQTDSGAGGTVVGNYCTWNPLDSAAGNTFSNGNLDLVTSSSTYGTVRGTIAVSSGKWYWEVTKTAGTAEVAIGIIKSSVSLPSYVYATADGYSYNGNWNGNKGNAASTSAYGSNYNDNDVVGVALDLDEGTLTFYKNGTSQGVAFTGLSGSFSPAVSDVSGANTATFVTNFGQRPFAYTAPSGFKALCTANLPTPTIANGATAMDVKLYTGNGSTQTVSGLGFSPDLVWVKKRNGATSHRLFDAVRGATKNLYSNTTDAEGTDATTLSSFDSAGFTLGDNGAVNALSDTYAAWCWDAGSSTVTNTSGSISSQVRANASAGFSVVTYTGTGANATVGHGLGVAPAFIITKKRSSTSNWATNAPGRANPWEGALLLNVTDAFAVSSAVWQNTAPTSTVFSIGTADAVNISSANYVAYCFAPVAGYSAFGSYTGNSSSDGPFVFCNFRPRWILIKQATSSGDGWYIYDAQRIGYNPTNLYLWANGANAEQTSGNFDLLSNGFKLRTTASALNYTGYTYIYAAFAESPFSLARAR